MGICPPDDAARVKDHLCKVSLPIHARQTNRHISQVKMTAEKLYQNSLHDKKVADGKVTFVIARGIGKSFLSQDINPENVKEIFQNSLLP